MTEQEIIDVVTHFKNGGEVEYRYKKIGSWMSTENPLWDFDGRDYRKKPEKKTRFMTPSELVGKCITNGDLIYFVLGARLIEDKVVVNDGRLKVSELVDDGWTLGDGSPLSVEVD